MLYYFIQSRATTGPIQTYGVHADSWTARALIAFNVASTHGARNDKLFDCLEDNTKTPPPGMIYSDTRGPIPIMILG